MTATLFFSDNYRRVQRGITSEIIHNILKLPVEKVDQDKLIVKLLDYPKEQFESDVQHLMSAKKDYGIETIIYS